jgi:hypothetical protein
MKSKAVVFITNCLERVRYMYITNIIKILMIYKINERLHTIFYMVNLLLHSFAFFFVFHFVRKRT